MDGIIFIAALILAIVLLLGTPIGISLLIIWIINKKGYDRRWKLIAFVPILTVGYFIYTALYPTDSFYKTDFREVTGINFPDEGKILFKTSTFPDPFGDYESISVVQVTRTFYDSLPSKLLSKGLTQQENKYDPFIIEDILKRFDGLTMRTEYLIETEKAGGVVYYVGFLSDNETVVVRRASW